MKTTLLLFLILGTAIIFFTSLQIRTFFHVWFLSSRQHEVEQLYVHTLQNFQIAPASRSKTGTASTKFKIRGDTDITATSSNATTRNVPTPQHNNTRKIGSDSFVQNRSTTLPADRSRRQPQELPRLLNLSFPTIDILSVGSRLFSFLQDAQKATFGSHRAVRHFYTATEDDDTEVGCHRRVNPFQAIEISSFCRRGDRSKFPLLERLSKRFIMRGKLRRKKNPGGWLCAQKRPIEGFMNMAKKYQYQSSSISLRRPETTNNNDNNLPDYLLIVDDDSFVNLDNVVQYIPTAYPVTKPHVVAGCMIVMDDILNFTMPHGGMGILFSRMALERFLQPIYCGSTGSTNSSTENFANASISTTESIVRHRDQRPKTMPSLFWKEETADDFERLACWQLEQNRIGEGAVFRDGMSVATLMHSYATDQPYQDVNQWNDVGNCLHSDTAWAYFTNYYHVAGRPPRPHFPPPPMPPTAPTIEQLADMDTNFTSRLNFLLWTLWAPDRLVGYNQSQLNFWSKEDNQTAMEIDQTLLLECRHGNDLPPFPVSGNHNCHPNAHFCHKITASYMHKLHQINLQRFPHHYHRKS